VLPETSALNIPQSPIAALGTITLLVGFVVIAYGAAAGLIGNTQRRRRLVTSSIHALYAFTGLMVLASALIIYAFVTHDYSIKYVAQYSDTSMPLAYKITAYWGGLDGSMLFWVAVLAVFSTLAVRANRYRHADMIGYVVAVILIVQIFFLAILIYSKNPFATFLTDAPPDGKGLNPLLQNYWMVIHPPTMYVGYTAATIPFAFGIAALASGRLDDQWLSSVRQWTLITWIFLSIGLILGGRWAYEELGWGGYWAWDPVENAGLLPWFTMTAFLHAVMIQEQRGMMKVWNLVLVVTSFFLTIFGTFMTRSGVVQSVHAFGQDNELALMFILFMAAILIVSFGLILFRLPQLRSTNNFESFISREYAFLLNNWILLACAFFVLFATMFPTLSEAVTGQRITVGPPFFNKWMVPMGLVLLFLAGATPLLAWRRTTKDRLISQFLFPTAFALAATAIVAIAVPRSRMFTAVFTDNIQLPITLINLMLCAFTIASVSQEFWRGVRVRRRATGSSSFTSLVGLVVSKRRKYGGYIVHVGVAVMFIGFAGKAYDRSVDRTVEVPGQEFQAGEYTFRYDDLITRSDDLMHSTTAHVALFHKGQQIGYLTPEKRQYVKFPDQPTTEVSIHSKLSFDVYLVLTGFDTTSKRANFRVYLNPLVNWVWIGFGLLLFGGLICLIPQRFVDSRMLRRGGGAAVAFLVVGSLLAAPQAAHAQGAEHEEQTFNHAGGASVGHLFRPNSPEFLQPFEARARAQVQAERPELEPGSDAFHAAVGAKLQPIIDLATRLMYDLVCLCGGCPREEIYTCKCGHAAGDREEALRLLSRFDLLSEKERAEAYDAVVAAFMEKYDGQHVLSMPIDKGFNRLAWIVPYTAVAMTLILLWGFGRRWVKRGQAAAANAGGSGELSEEDETYAELLDEELRDTD
jgi:cytochrome c-type biogenesis protein CcmF